MAAGRQPLSLLNPKFPRSQIKTRMKSKLLALFGLAAAFCSAQAGVVLSDNFTYSDGALVRSGSPWSLHSGTAGTMLVSNNVLVVSGSRSEDLNAPLAGAPYLESDPSAKLYSSFKMAISNNLPSLSGTYIAHFRGTNTGAATDFGARIFLLTTNTINPANGVAAGKYRVHVSNGSLALTDNAAGQFDQDLSTNVVYTIVTRFIPSTGVATIWVNPNSETDPSATATDVGSAARPNPFSVFTYAFRQASGSGTAYVDDLKIGTTFGDVAGVNTSPTISSIVDQAVPANGATGVIGFTVNDGETAAGSLTVTATSANTTLVPNGSPSIVLGGSGASRTITVTPVVGQQGSTLITVTVSDGVNSSYTTFTLSVGAPSISAVADQFTLTGTPTTAIPFTVGDAETPNALTVVGSSSNPTLVQAGKIVISGSGASRSVVITPEAGESGVADITLTVNDGTLTASTRFTLAVHPALGVQFSDTFPYPDGLITVGSSSVWLSHSGGAANDALIVDFKLVLNYTNAMDVNAYFRSDFLAATPASGTVLYSKFNVKFLSLPGTNGGSYFAHFKDTGISNFRGRVYALTDGAAAGKFRLGVANQSGSVSSVYPQDLDLNTTYTVVTRIVVANGKSTLWINPRTESSDSVTATDQTGGTDLYTYCFRQDSGIGVLTVDDLVIGTTFTEAVPYVAPPSPIPLMIELMGDQIMLTWTDASFKLQSSSSINGPYTDVPGGTSGYMVPATGATYYRLKY